MTDKAQKCWGPSLLLLPAEGYMQRVTTEGLWGEEGLSRQAWLYKEEEVEVSTQAACIAFSLIPVLLWVHASVSQKCIFTQSISLCMKYGASYLRVNHILQSYIAIVR